MKNVSQELIITIKSCDSNTCADILHNELITRYDGIHSIMTYMKTIPYVTYYTHNAFTLRDETATGDEYWYESEVVELIIHTKFQIPCITEDIFKHLRQID